MSQLQANVPDHLHPAAPGQPVARPYAVPAARTSWGALTLAFLAGGFTCFVVMSLLAIVFVVCVSAMGSNANNTFQYVAPKVGASDAPANNYFPPPPPGDPTFKRVSDTVKGPGNDSSDSRDAAPKDKDR